MWGKLVVFGRLTPGTAVSGLEPWPGTWRCVLGQDTSLSKCSAMVNAMLE